MTSSLLSPVVINIMTKSHLGKKGFISSYTLQYIVKGSKDRNSRQGHGNRNRIRDHGEILLI